MNTTFSRRAMLGGVAAMAQAAPPSSRPNVIVILFDDLGTHDLGFLGAKDALRCGRNQYRCHLRRNSAEIVSSIIAS